MSMECNDCHLIATGKSGRDVHFAPMSHGPCETCGKTRNCFECRCEGNWNLAYNKSLGNEWKDVALTASEKPRERTWTESPEELAARRSVHVQHEPVALAEPPESHIGTVSFVVTLTGTEPPPDWADDQERILRKEMRLTFPQAEIERLVDGELANTHVALFKGSSFHDCLTELGPVLRNFVDCAPVSPAVVDGRDQESEDICFMAMQLMDLITKRANRTGRPV